MPPRLYQTEETIQRIKDAVTGIPKSQEHRANISAGLKGKKKSPEHIHKLTEARRNRKFGPMSQEVKDKIRAAQIGRKKSAEQIEKNRISHVGLPSSRKGAILTDETIGKIRGARATQMHPAFINKGITQEMIDEATANGLKWCSGSCKTFLPLAKFYMAGNAKTRLCIQCIRSNNKSYWDSLTEEQKSELSDQLRDYRINNPEKIRRAWVSRKYGVTLEWYAETLAAQGGHCALCPTTVDERKMPPNALPGSSRQYLPIDHDHETGRARGLLCAKCNTALHRVEYIADWAWKAMEYLEKHGSDRKVRSGSIGPESAVI